MPISCWTATIAFSIARQHKQDLIEARVWEYPTPQGLGPDVDLVSFLHDGERSEFLANYGRCGPQAVATRSCSLARIAMRT